MKCEKPIPVFMKSVSRAFLVPCNNCLSCRKRKQARATFRIDAHRRFSSSKHCYFLTLTYADKFLPYEYIKCDTRTGEILSDIKSESPILNPNDIVNFFKRFRRYTGESIKYFYVGEYGDKFDRPHWHAIVHTDLNWRLFRDACMLAWSVSVTGEDSFHKGTFSVSRSYVTHRLSMGRISVSQVNMRRIRYCAKYVVKDNNSNSLVPKFARWSKGYGIDWLKSSEAKTTKLNKVLFSYTSDCKPVFLDRFYTHKLYDKDTLDSLTLKIALNDYPPDSILGDYRKMRLFMLEKQKKEYQSYFTSKLLTFNPVYGRI